MWESSHGTETKVCGGQIEKKKNLENMDKYTTGRRDLELYSCEKNIVRKEVACNSHLISPLLTLFSTLYGTYFPF